MYKLLLLCILLMFSSCKLQPNQISSVVLPDGMKQVAYEVAKDKSYQPFDDSYDLYTADENTISKNTFVKYDKTFGYVQNERTAVDIATIVFSEIYHDCAQKEAPFVVHYNENAAAWIVNGTLPADMFGGVAYIAIKKDTGKILMLVHTK